MGHTTRRGTVLGGQKLIEQSRPVEESNFDGNPGNKAVLSPDVAWLYDLWNARVRSGLVGGVMLDRTTLQPFPKSLRGALSRSVVGTAAIAAILLAACSSETGNDGTGNMDGVMGMPSGTQDPTLPGATMPGDTTTAPVGTLPGDTGTPIGTDMPP